MSIEPRSLGSQSSVPHGLHSTQQSHFKLERGVVLWLHGLLLALVEFPLSANVCLCQLLLLRSVLVSQVFVPLLVTLPLESQSPWPMIRIGILEEKPFRSLSPQE